MWQFFSAFWMPDIHVNFQKFFHSISREQPIQTKLTHSRVLKIILLSSVRK